MALKFFHIPKTKKFSITPRYYDPEAEERVDRENRIRSELGMPVTGEPRDSSKPYRPNLRGQFRKAMSHDSKTTLEARRKSNHRLLIIMAILAMLMYILFYR